MESGNFPQETKQERTPAQLELLDQIEVYTAAAEHALKHKRVALMGEFIRRYTDLRSREDVASFWGPEEKGLSERMGQIISIYSRIVMSDLIDSLESVCREASTTPLTSKLKKELKTVYACIREQFHGGILGGSDFSISVGYEEQQEFKAEIYGILEKYPGVSDRLSPL